MPPAWSRLLRLGVYVDAVFRRDHECLSADRAVLHFVSGLAASLEELVIFGRLDPSPGVGPHRLPPGRLRLVPLPYYRSAASPLDLLRSFRGSLAAVEQELSSIDALWLFGPHPMALAFARLARSTGTPIFLGVRQDLLRYTAARTSGLRAAAAIPAAIGIDHAFRHLARSWPTVLVGDRLARSYAGGAPTLSTGFSLVREKDLVPPEVALRRRWSGDLRLLTVGRLSPEKNPLLLPDILARLRRLHGSWRLTIAGEGPLRDALLRRAAELGVAESLDDLGYIPAGSALWERYRTSHAFLHVSVTEGIPQVIFEAQAAGIPVVATDVGSVRSAFGSQSTALLIPPGDAAAAAIAVDRLRTEPQLRRQLVANGARNAADQTMDRQLTRILQFFQDNLP